MSWIDAIIIAIVEGITEFLPISSTGHMIITEALLGHIPDDFSKAYIVNIQFGAILAVVVMYFKRFFQSWDFYTKLFVAFLPAAIIGFLLGDYIDSLLESVMVVAIMLVAGGLFMLFVDKWFNKPVEDQKVSFWRAVKIGIFQCIAMIPGVSRSMATIVGGMTTGLNRKNAAEFSFFLAVPTMAAASGYKLMKLFKEPGGVDVLKDNLSMLLVGNIVAFVVAMLAIKLFIDFLTRHGFKAFGYYRILVGGIILALMLSGHSLSIS
jgi:undecaprenyl-diphosphatase